MVSDLVLNCLNGLPVFIAITPPKIDLPFGLKEEAPNTQAIGSKLVLSQGEVQLHYAIYCVWWEVFIRWRY
jgi:hypothetical protein